MSQQAQPGKQSPEDKAKAALDTFLDHPFWRELPRAVSKGFDRVDQFFEKGEFDEILAGGEACAELIANASRHVMERGQFGEPEAAFLAAARTEFGQKKSFLATTINFMQAVVGSVDPDDKKTPKQVQDHLDLMRFIYIAARDKPELLELLNDSRYKNLDPSVCNNPNLDKLLDELVKNGCVHALQVGAVKAMLSPLRRSWTEDRCAAASKAFAEQRYLRDQTQVQARQFVEKSSLEYPKVATKLLTVAHGLRVAYTEGAVLRFETICYMMLNACKGVHA
ncbi:MAG: hypothetical protein NTX72_05610 [Candidatus Uhrbacteria bacterium]|nr:hypothetical protein [Candidatus Uhrbacteria bacterium]